MKKIICTVAAVLAFGFANAQDKEFKGFKQHDMFAEGAFSIRSSDSGSAPTDVSNSYSFTPKVGYMYTDKMAFGGFLDFSGTKYNNNDKDRTYGIGVFARYYFLSLGDDNAFNAYGEVGLGYSNLKTEPSDPLLEEDTRSAFNANIDLGMNYFFTKNWAISFTLANILSYNNSNPEQGENTSDIEVNINLFNNFFDQPQFGLLYKW